ncbi:MAG: lactoylglutathione lyase [Nitrosospira sp.]|nr:lactoylglutathione lyase [Nitrosospira sp.]
MALKIKSLRPYVPARDFELSKRFYAALGFTMSEGWGGTADFTLNGCGFRLQDYYVKDWANNFMFVVGVDDAMVLHVLDPSGVLLVLFNRRKD